MVNLHPSLIENERNIESLPQIELSLVVPVFNEMEMVKLFIDRISCVFNNNKSINIELVFVNDGSTDETLIQLLGCQKSDSRIRVVDLSRNFGKEAALTAGLQISKGRVVVPMDVDLQDPPEIILDMIELWREGYDVVLGRRNNRKSDSLAKRLSSYLFYYIHNIMADSKIPRNVGDFRLMDRAVIEALNNLPESRRFMKGLFAWAGFRTTTIDYARPKRVAGTSKFNGWRLWNFALEGVTSFSTAPLRIWSYIGGLIASFSFIYSFYIFFRVVTKGIDVPGYASIIISVTFLGGLQLIGIGIIGEYLGRNYIETKRRPIYLVRKIYEKKD